MDAMDDTALTIQKGRSVYRALVDALSRHIVFYNFSVALALVSGVLYAVCVAMNLPLWRFGSNDERFDWVPWVTAGLVLLWPAAIPMFVVPFALLSNAVISGRPVAKRVVRASVIIWIGAASALMALVWVAPRAYVHWKLKEASHRGNMIVAAVQQYKDDHGALPAELNVLVPRYLHEIPSPGFAPDISFEYGRYKSSPTALSKDAFFVCADVHVGTLDTNNMLFEYASVRGTEPKPRIQIGAWYWR